MVEGRPAPVFVRISGIPADTMADFASGLCEGEVSRLQAVRSELARARAELVDRLHAVIPDVLPSLRRALLAVKRDAFNGRGLARHSGTDSWAELRRLVGAAADAVHQLEEKLEARTAELEETHARIRESERRRLLALLDDPALLRGIALASPVLVESLQRHLDSGGTGSPRNPRLEASLLRYVSRAALKLSPYSTLTRSALGEARDDLSAGGPRLLGKSWSQRSLVRLKRYSLSQITELLRRHPPVKERLRVVLNNSTEELAPGPPGRYRFLTPAGWVLDPESGRVRSVLPAVVTANLEGPVASRLWRELPEKRVTWTGLTAWLRTELPGESSSEEVEKLHQLGFLRCLWPWPANEGHLEKCLLSFLDTLSDARLQTVVDLLGRLVALEEGFPDTCDPARSALEIERLLDRIWEAVLELLALGPEIQRPRVKKGEIYEDVLLASSGEIVDVPAVSMRDAVKAIDPVWRLTHLFHPRHDFLHTLGAVIAERWPDRREVGILELLSSTRSLWREHARFLASVRRADGWRETFNPLALPALEKLAQLRLQVWEEAVASVRSVDGESRICSATLEEAMDRVPEMYSSPLGACLLLQPADSSGQHWMVNRIFEGTGRYGSRFTPLLDEPARNSYTGHFAARSSVAWNGEELELLDLVSTQGDTLNVHAAQTRCVLEIPGEEQTQGPVRRLRLADLRIRLQDGTGRPVLIDTTGRRYLPVFLGGASQEFLPVPLKLLALFGPAEIRPVLPPARERREGAAVVRERLRLYNLILSRKRWIVPQASWPEVGGLTEAAAFAEINLWRSGLGIPDRVFVIEKISSDPVEVFKPQYIDFTSPLFVEIVRSILQTAQGVIKIEEALPSLDAMPRDAGGARWAVEILSDSLAFREEISYSCNPRSNTVTAEVKELAGGLYC